MSRRFIDKARRSPAIKVALGALAAFLLIVLIAQLTSGSVPTAARSPQSAAPAATAGPLHPNAPLVIGEPNARVTMIMWTDLRCPYCGVFSRDTMPAIIDEYVATGQVVIEVRDVAYFGDESEQAAVAVRAAANQGMFAEYLRTVYAAAPEKGRAELPRARLIEFAEESGIPDLAQFENDLDDPALLTAVKARTSEAKRIGVTGVPFFAAGGVAVSGAQPIGVFRQFLDEALTKAG